jgi:hypothetical protein
VLERLHGTIDLAVELPARDRRTVTRFPKPAPSRDDGRPRPLIRPSGTFFPTGEKGTIAPPSSG